MNYNKYKNKKHEGDARKTGCKKMQIWKHYRIHFKVDQVK